MIELLILNKENKIMSQEKGAVIDFMYNGEYQEGDKLIINKGNMEFLAIQLDENIAESIIYAPSSSVEFEIPTGELKKGYAPEAFSGCKHRIRISETDEESTYGLRNIALNPHDKRGQKKYYPHAYANLVTREAVCFFERNAIDGVKDNLGHGDYPYHSWAGGAREDLEYYIDFGREVEVEKQVFYLRADFPHDTYWKNIDIEFSDGTKVTADFEGTKEGQEVVLPEKIKTKTIHLTNFKQVSFPLSWAALSQVQVYGRYIKEDLSKHGTVKMMQVLRLSIV